MNIIFGSVKKINEVLRAKFIQNVHDRCSNYDYKILKNSDEFLVLSKGSSETYFIENLKYKILFDGYVNGYIEKDFNSYLNTLAVRITSNRKVLQGNESGIFNVVIFDLQNNSLSISNDSSGLFPFYYTIHNNVLFFCSHLHFLGKILNLDIDPVALIQRLAFNNGNLGSRTIYKNLKRICPGEAVSYDCEKNILNINSTQEYYIQYISKRNDTEDKIWNSLNDEVKYITSKSRKIGMMLSEGFDSRFIGGLFQNNGAQLYTFTHGTIQNGKKSVGINITEDVADELKSSHYFHPMDEGFPSDYPDIISQLFLADNLNIAYWSYGSEYFRNLDVDCVTTGYGLDSTLGGFFFFKDKYSRLEAVVQRYKEIFMQDLNIMSDEYVETLSSYLINKVIRIDKINLKKKINNLFNNQYAELLNVHMEEFESSIVQEFKRIENSGSTLSSQMLQRFFLENVTRRCFFGQDLTLRINRNVVVPSFGRLFMKEISSLHPKYRILHKTYIRIFRKYLKELAKIKNAGYNLPITRSRVILESSRFVSKYKEIKIEKEIKVSKGKSSIEKLRAAFNPELLSRKGDLIKKFYEIIENNKDIINADYMKKYLKLIETYESNSSYMNPFYDIIEYETILK